MVYMGNNSKSSNIFWIKHFNTKQKIIVKNININYINSMSIVKFILGKSYQLINYNNNFEIWLSSYNSESIIQHY